ncbi:orotate phosphoribosyltransferase [Candidatus Margulisiibacteriota bacterium]
MLETINLELLKKIKETSILEGKFTTRAGKKTNYYVDKYLFETKPDILNSIADELVKILPNPNNYDRIAAPELGAVALAAVVSIKVGKPFIIIKKQTKDYGTKKHIEGEFKPSEKVVVLEDILTTGGAVLRACDILLAEKMKILEIVGVFNREEGAEENITAKNLTMKALFKKSDLSLC